MAMPMQNVDNHHNALAAAVDNVHESSAAVPRRPRIDVDGIRSCILKENSPFLNNNSGNNNVVVDHVDDHYGYGPVARAMDQQGLRFVRRHLARNYNSDEPVLSEINNIMNIHDDSDSDSDDEDSYVSESSSVASDDSFGEEEEEEEEDWDLEVQISAVAQQLALDAQLSDNDPPRVAALRVSGVEVVAILPVLPVSPGNSHTTITTDSNNNGRCSWIHAPTWDLLHDEATAAAAAPANGDNDIAATPAEGGVRVGGPRDVSEQQNMAIGEQGFYTSSSLYEDLDDEDWVLRHIAVLDECTPWSAASTEQGDDPHGNA